MKRALILLLSIASSASLSAHPEHGHGPESAPAAATSAMPDYPVKVTAIPLPAGDAPRTGATFARDRNGEVYFAWIESLPEDISVFRYAKYDERTQTWGEARTISQGRDWITSTLNIPQFIVRDRIFTAVWFTGTPVTPKQSPQEEGHSHGHSWMNTLPRAWFSQSHDGGRTWQAPEPLSRESPETNFVALQALPGGQVLAAWMDGRVKDDAHSVKEIRSRIIGSDSDAPEALIDRSVCDCCAPTLMGLPDGGALLAYRAHRDGSIRDIHTARYEAGKGWQAPRILSADRWQIAGCPLNGPRLAHTDGNISAIWFTASRDKPRVMIASSDDNGDHFTSAQEIDQGAAIGRGDIAALDNGSRVLVWMERAPDGLGLSLRCVSPENDMSPVSKLALGQSLAPISLPRIVPLNPEPGAPRQLLLSVTEDTETSALNTYLLTLPD